MKTINLQEENYKVLVNLLKESLKISKYHLSDWESQYESINEFNRQAKTKANIIERYEYFTNRVNELENLLKDLDISE